MPYFPKKNEENEGDYEIVSFEDFCDKPSTAKPDLLNLNDNINYRLCYETDGCKLNYDGENSGIALNETSLGGFKNVAHKRKQPGGFAPFGRYHPKTPKGPLFGAVIPKPRAQEQTSAAEPPRYQRFSRQHNICQRFWDILPGMGTTILILALICTLCIVWWGVFGALGGAWSEEHYKKLWERVHPDVIKKQISPVTPVTYEKPIMKLPPPIVHTETEIPQVQTPEIRYHDHNNLSTKNKNNVETKKLVIVKVKAKYEVKEETETESPKVDIDKEREARIEFCKNYEIDDKDRFDCGVDANQTVCEDRGCCWRKSKVLWAPYCFYPPNYDSFKLVNITESRLGVRAEYARGRRAGGGYPNPFARATVLFKYLAHDILQIKIFDPTQRRFEPALPEIPLGTRPLSAQQYRVQVQPDGVGFKVIRNSDNVTLMDTHVGALILSDKFLEISTLLPTHRVFGLGENRERFRKELGWKTITMFNRDNIPMNKKNLYGTHPFYLAVEKNGNSHGVFLLNSNAIDVTLQPTPALTFRAIGGIFNFFVFTGPTPEQVVAQYTSIIGRPFMPPYWALGFHLSKYGYHDLFNTRNVWKRNRDAGIPFDTQWNDMEYMNRQNGFTVDENRFKDLPKFVKELHDAGMHYVLVLHPGVSGSEPAGSYSPLDRGMKMNVFVRNTSGMPFLGRAWNRDTTLFPDFTHPNGTPYWLEMMSELHNRVPYDGVWIDMNEPENRINGQRVKRCDPLQLPYRPRWSYAENLNTRTICMEARHHIGKHYDVHNLYGLYQAVATHFALEEIRGKRPFIISRASFPGLGRYAGHWSGDVRSTWEDMQYSIPEMLSMSLFGVAMMGSDICGYSGGTSPALCKRWMQLGAFYPFARNHNDQSSKPQDPVSMGAEVVAASLAALRLRYRLLPHYYTLFWRAHTDGTTVVTPLLFLEPDKENIDFIDSQFLIGRHVMIAPILVEDAETTTAYFPAPHPWYNIRDGRRLARGGDVVNVTDDQMVTVQGGIILPLQEPPLTGPVTTTNTRSRPLQLYVVPSGRGGGAGELYWDDGESIHSYEERKYSHIEFTLKDQVLASTVVWWGYGVPPVNNITVLAQNRPVKTVTINGTIAKFQYNENAEILYVININLSLDKPFTLKWTYGNAIIKEKNSIDAKEDIQKTVDIVNNTVVECKGKDCLGND